MNIMNDIKIKSGVIFGFLLALIFSGQGVYSQQVSFENALKTAKKEHKKVIVDIYTDWCGWCKKMDREAYSDEGIKKIIKDDFIYVKLNAEGKGLASLKMFYILRFVFGLLADKVKEKLNNLFVIRKKGASYG